MVFLASSPTQTPQVMRVEKPTNHASVWLSVVPVLPATGQPSSLARAPVPRWASQFVDWLEGAMAAGEREALLDYRRLAPGAVESHPHDDHLRPLFVALGAAQGKAPTLLHESWDGGSLYMGAYRFD